MQKVFACFDVKAAQYGGLILLPTRGLALRSFSDACADPKSPMAQYPGDFAMHELGSFDPSTGELKALPRPEIVATAAAVIQQLQAARKVEEAEVVA